MSEIPNKCDYCGLKEVLPPSYDDDFVNLRKLYDEKIIGQIYPKSVIIGGVSRSEFCLASSDSWGQGKKIRPCKHWQLKLGSGLPKEQYLSLHAARKMEVLTDSIHSMTMWMLLITGGALIVALLALFYK